MWDSISVFIKLQRTFKCIKSAINKLIDTYSLCVLLSKDLNNFFLVRRRQGILYIETFLDLCSRYTLRVETLICWILRKIIFWFDISQSFTKNLLLRAAWLTKTPRTHACIQKLFLYNSSLIYTYNRKEERKRII